MVLYTLDAINPVLALDYPPFSRLFAFYRAPISTSRIRGMVTAFAVGGGVQVADVLTVRKLKEIKQYGKISLLRIVFQPQGWSMFSWL